MMILTSGYLSENKVWKFADLPFLGIIFALIGAPLIKKVVLNLLVKKRRKSMVAKVVLITGASSGLGEALSHTFYRAGCKVILAARRELELKRVYKDLLALKVEGPTCVPDLVVLDLEDLSGIPEIINKVVERHNRIDLLVNNGGISVRGDVLSTSMEVYNKIMTTNFLGSVALTKAVLPSMIQNTEGRIVFVSSVQGKFALPFRSAYCASKHAIQAFSDSLRAEVVKYNIKVTCISPGYIKTSLSNNALTGDGSKYGQMDDSTANGTHPSVMANYIFLSILKDEKDVIFAQKTAKLAYWLKFLFPTAYFWIMQKRANCK
ncbi:dehydrogenase/reductase SDR family protein 7-like [Condylostylus longicornis]|uniref:dehydrogenase/reductase SDR family protein 7-like n=1 Tax=Condylostylus longicornis TaxID=2530218 RepID=UPI00244E5192|nr:dehydrogenase/reductase SDR family protein 7-like [Condylostylus longicornis]